MKILIACEESQAVCIEMRKLGHEAYSCDLLPCSGQNPEWHLQTDVVEILKQKWDMIIAFPPCTYLTVSANKWYKQQPKRKSGVLVGKERLKARLEAIEFFMLFANANCDKIAIENPIGCMSSQYRKPDQIIHPYYFGDPERKSTCLWLKGLKPLNHDKSNHVEPNIIKYKNGKGTNSKWHMDTLSLPPKERSIARSKTFPWIAKAMADQRAGNA